MPCQCRVVTRLRQVVQVLIQYEEDLAENLHELEVSDAVAEQLEGIKVRSARIQDVAKVTARDKQWLMVYALDHARQWGGPRGGICPD